MSESHREMFARLSVLSALQTASIKANPMPYIKRLSAENYKLRMAIEDALILLSGADNFDLAREIAPHMQPSIVETALARNRRAAERLNKGLQKVDIP